MYSRRNLPPTASNNSEWLVQWVLATSRVGDYTAFTGNTNSNSGNGNAAGAVIVGRAAGRMFNHSNRNGGNGFDAFGYPSR